MKRSMMQVYVKESDKAVELYKQAFEAQLVAGYTHADGTFMHGELSICGQILAVSEALPDEERITGNTMQFCLHLGEGKEKSIEKIYNAFKADSEIIYPLSPCDYSVLMFDLIDKYKVRWCVFV